MIAVLGAGGVGGLLAALLSCAGEDVLVVAPEDTAGRIASGGLHVRSERFGELTARPAASSRLDRQAQLLIVAVKAPALPDALERIDAGPALTLPLLNGFEHFELLRQRLPKVMTGTIRVQAERTGPGEIVHSSDFLRIDVAPPGDEAEVRRRLARAGRHRRRDRRLRARRRLGQARAARRAGADDGRLRAADRRDPRHARAARRAVGGG